MVGAFRRALRPRGLRRNDATALAWVIVGCGSCAAPAEALQSAADVSVRVDPRVELVSIIFRLADYDEYRMGRVAGYLRDVDEHFGAHHDDPVVSLARGLRGSRSIGFDACMSMAVHLSDAFPPALRRPVTDDDTSLEGRWDKASADEFARLAGEFARTTQFAQFFTKHENLYAQSVSRMREVLAKEAHMEWFQAFYGARPTAAFHLVLGMLNGPGNYGVKFEAADGTEELYCIFGVEKTDQEGVPVFESRVALTVAHEFSHSFVNHVVEAHRRSFEAPGRMLFAAVEAEMRRLAYGNWKTMLDESLVRAATVRYLMKYGTPEAVRRHLAWEVEDNGFLWLSDLVDLLGEYEQSREQYATFESFMPRVIAFFRGRAPEYVRDAEARHKKMDTHRPHVVKTEPPNGAQGVDPAVDKIVITFDLPMSPGGYSIMYIEPDGSEHFPEVTGRPRYDRTGTTLTLPVRLKPNWAYRFSLNSDAGGAFKSREGVPLKRYDMTFTTGPGR